MSRVRGDSSAQRSLRPSTRALGLFASLAAATLAAPLASASPTHVLRFATAAPDGTEWARLSRTFSREVEEQTHGDVQIKWYFGGIAGNEIEMIDRMRRGQLDGVASAGMLCQRLAPSMRVVHIVGLFQSREEALYVVGRLKPRVDRELDKAGFTNLGEAGFGTDILFSRAPIRSFDELKQARMWTWDLDEVYKQEMPALGMRATPLPLESALAAFDKGELDGFIGIPSAALVFQWAARARYFSDLRVGYVMGCLVATNSAFDPLPLEAQRAVQGAAGRLMRHMEDVGQQQDDMLINSLFAKQGAHRVEVSPSFRTEFLDAARAARLKLGGKLTTQTLLDEVNGWLADYRSDHR